jgi:ParB family chromosome partitioning protein
LSPDPESGENYFGTYGEFYFGIDIVMEDGDDAAAIEASLAENIERLPMDEIDQYKAFSKLVHEGKSVEDIVATFGITERMVAQRLALGRLHAPILTAYRKGDLDPQTLRSLTLATTKQQKAWWALFKDAEAYAPMGRALRDWLFGGAHIPTENALFDVEASGLDITADLFGEDAYFADAQAFWPLQNAAIADLAEEYRADGWCEVVVLDVGMHWLSWEHVSTSKEDSGKVFIACTSQGEVETHEGYITQAEARKRVKVAEGGTTVEKPEITKPMQNYLDLHRHAAVRSDLLTRPDIALRLIVAHMLAGSLLWRVEAEPQRTAKPEIAESLAANKAEQAFAQERTVIAALLGLDEAETVLTGRDSYHATPCTAEVFAKTLTLSDDDITRILTFLMAESLEAGGGMIEALGQMLRTDMATCWTPDDTFFDLMRDKDALNAMVGEIAGKPAAKEHVTATAKSQKAVIRACLDGTREAKVENWQPRYMAFPMRAYTKRKGFPAIDGWTRIKRHFEAA